MSGSSLLLLIDDIATLLDDVAAMSKIAAKKTAGVLGDDLALNAQQVSGVKADRELPVVWAVAKGSFLNKLILVPAALLISAFIPWLITPLLLLGGLFLCFEGIEKIVHTFFHNTHEKEQHHDELVTAISDPDVDIVSYEQEKITGAIRTDFILSAEIIAITLGVVASQPLITQAGVLSAIAIMITIVVYGLVAGIVRLDDWGLYLNQREGASLFSTLQRKLGYGIIVIAPYLMKTLSIVGTAAMFLVGGGIITHSLHWFDGITASIATAIQNLPAVGGFLTAITPTIVNGVIGIIAGCLVLLIVTAIKKILKK